MTTHRRWRLAMAATLALVGAVGVVAQTASEPDTTTADPPPPVPRVHVVPYDGPITPVASDFLVDRLAEADAAGVEAVIIELDTPGGLDSSMRDIIKAMLASPVPVIVHVAPSGARAASAGAFITLAAHASAMAPGTNIGSASPVQMGGAIQDTTVAAKVSNDAAAYIASLARQRGRDEELARKFVTEALNLTATEAREAGMIDVVAATTTALLDSLDGRTVTLEGREETLAIAGAEVTERDMGARRSLLMRLVDPNVAYILMLIGIYGLFFELSNPGAFAPGILGGICLLLALFAFQALPVNYAGVALIILGTVLLILEVKVTSFGALTIGGIAALVLGSLMLFDSAEPWAQVSLRVMIPAIAVFAGFFILCVWLVVRGHRRPPVTGPEAIAGEQGRVVRPIGGGADRGKVVVHGETWDAVADVEIPVGQLVEVESVVGRVVHVTGVGEAIGREPEPKES
ncbi:nodulation protein NfeD [bacterium]|nr:nodulation protein NfeD [bacterium]